MYIFSQQIPLTSITDVRGNYWLKSYIGSRFEIRVPLRWGLSNVASKRSFGSKRFFLIMDLIKKADETKV
jgi:hypothetical protein